LKKVKQFENDYKFIANKPREDGWLIGVIEHDPVLFRNYYFFILGFCFVFFITILAKSKKNKY